MYIYVYIYMYIGPANAISIFLHQISFMHIHGMLSQQQNDMVHQLVPMRCCSMWHPGLIFGLLLSCWRCCGKGCLGFMKLFCKLLSQVFRACSGHSKVVLDGRRTRQWRRGDLAGFNMAREAGITSFTK